MSLVNYLGTYETLDQVWEAYPEGGKEGDYLYIASVLKKWNKYTSAWADPTEEDVEGSTIVSLEEDVVVGSSTLINYLGRFETLGDALNAYPEGGNEGDYIYVGDDIYAWDKYANEWVVSSDAPLEVAISEEDIIPNSNIFINYLGGFVDRDAVWQKYPEGGKVGDYLYIASDLHIWDKYICNWVAATPPDESSQIRPIEVLTQEGVVEYSENYINYLGVFESIEQAWEAYPEGGKEGDYIIVDGEQLRWNKYTSNWGEYDPDASTPARPVATIYGDLHVHNDVVIGEDLYARILETFTTKKWVLEQEYISMDDVTSELVMSKIVPDNTTIEVRDGKLVVIGGGVEWDNITGKPSWIGDTKPTYTLDEIVGSNGDGFVTLLSDQTIEGVKNFANGAKFNGALLSYDEKKKAWVFPGNIIASGGITAFGSLSTPVASLFEALPIDGTTIKRDPVTNELYVDTNVVGGSGGSSLDEEQLEEYLKPYAKTADVANTYATKSSVNALSTQLNDFLSGSDTDTIINKWSELETFLAGLAETDDLATILSGKANKATTLAGYGITDAYTKSHMDSNFVTIGTKQEITGEKDFVGGFKVNGGLVEYNATLKTWVFNGDLLVTGGMSAFSNISGFKPSTITEAVLIDNKTIKLNADGLLYAVAQGAGDINEDQLADYLTTNGYATQDWVTGRGYFLASNFTKVNIKSALGISDWALASASPVIKNERLTNLDAATPWTAFSTSFQASNSPATANYFTGFTLTNVDYQGQDSTYRIQLAISHTGTLHTRYRSGGSFKAWNTIAFTSDIPTSLKNPTALSWSGFSSGSYDGSTAQSIAIPSNTNQLTNGAGFITASASITGNAATSNRLVEEVVTDLNNATAGRIFTMTSGYGSTDGNKPDTGWVTGLTLRYAQNGTYRRQLAFCYDDLYLRRENNANWGAWSKILAENNYSDYALPITGGVVNGKVDVIYRYGSATAGEDMMRVGCYVSNPYGLSLGTASASMSYIQSKIFDNSLYTLLALNPFGGNVALGGTTASEKLHVYGNILATGGITAPTFTGVASNATYWNAPSSIRPTTANIPVVGNTTFSHFLATSSMTTGKPSNDGYIIHGEWDTVAGWSSQLFLANGTPDANNRMQWRAMDSGTWGEWKSVAFIDTGMLKPTQGLQINHIGSNYAEGIRLANRNGISNTWSEINFGCDPSVTTGTHATQWTVGRNGNNNYFVIRNNATDRIQIDLSGNTTLTGNFVATGGITAQNSSDRRLKKNIRKFNASKVLMSLGGVWEYEYIDSEVQKNHIYEGTHFGLIYQHVKGTKLDVMCHEREDGMGALNYIHQKFISLIAGATMENISEVQKLNRKIRHLEAKVKQLENRA